MTLTTAIKITANRVGLLETNSSFKDRSRDYLNIIAKRIGTRAKWNWLHKTTTFNTTADTQTYQLATDVLTPHSFTDQSNNQPLGIVGWDVLDLADPDRGETGDVDVVTIEGVDATTGRGWGIA